MTKLSLTGRGPTRSRREPLDVLIAGGGVAAAVLMLIGGGFYSLGAAAYATRRPDPSPTTFGYHEVFHACTLLGAACHYIGIWLALY